MKATAFATQSAVQSAARNISVSEHRNSFSRSPCGCGACARCSGDKSPVATPASDHRIDLSGIPAKGGERVYQSPPKTDGGTQAPPGGSQTPPGDKPPATENACKVSHFSMKFEKWDISWPWSDTGNTTIRLPVKFRLELAPGSKKSDCMIGQDKKGFVPRPSPPDEWSSWASDSPYGGWWTGSEWQAADGSWDWFGNDAATFHDAPGFNSVEHYAYPLYWGGVGKKGHFEFNTWVLDLKTKAKVRELKWGMLIDYSAPKKGQHQFYT